MMLYKKSVVLYILISCFALHAYGNEESVQQIKRKIEENRVCFVDFIFSDIFGNRKEITVPINHVNGALINGLTFDGSSIPGFSSISESDMILKPDLDTFSIVPWSTQDTLTGRFVCTVYENTEQPFEGDPRYILQKTLEQAAQMGYDFHVGPELEFFLFKESSNGQRIPCDNNRYFDAEVNINMQHYKRVLLNALLAQGINVEKLHNEVAPGQHEVSLLYDNALKIADQVMLTKQTITTLAHNAGLLATFMPKPMAGHNGSAMHIHFSLYDVANQKNVFYDENDGAYLSQTAKYFIAGVLNHIDEFTAIFNTTINSYKRLIPSYEAPIYKCWGLRNRSVLIRIPQIIPGMESAARAEIRSPDPLCNPYLAFAALLASGLEGIKNKEEVPLVMEENIYHLAENELHEKGIILLPNTLEEALAHLYASDFARSLFGDNFVNKYVQQKQQEINAYKSTITNWELEQYF